MHLLATREGKLFKIFINGSFDKSSNTDGGGSTGALLHLGRT